MGFIFPSRCILLTFCLLSLILRVSLSQPTNVTTMMLEESTTDSSNTTAPINKTALLVGKMNDYQGYPSNTGSGPAGPGFGSTDLILIIGCVVSIVFLSVIVFAIYRFQVRKKAEYSRAAKIQVSSTRNAGVYMDLAMDNPISKSDLPISVPIYNSMKKRQDQYTFISDDELDL